MTPILLKTLKSQMSPVSGTLIRYDFVITLLLSPPFETRHRFLRYFSHSIFIARLSLMLLEQPVILKLLNYSACSIKMYELVKNKFIVFLFYYFLPIEFIKKMFTIDSIY